MPGGNYLLGSNNHIHGYYKAADISVDSALDSYINRHRDILFFPIVFKYRPLRLPRGRRNPGGTS